MKLRLFLSLIIFPVMIFAAAKTEKFPDQCRVSGLRFSHQSISFYSQHTAKPGLYVLTNDANHPIWLIHERKNNPGVGAGWASQLMPNKWSAILITRRQFDLQCQYQNKKGAMINLPCKTVLHACQFSRFYSKNPINSSFWVVENLPFQAMMSRIQARGFVFPIKK